MTADTGVDPGSHPPSSIAPLHLPAEAFAMRGLGTWLAELTTFLSPAESTPMLARIELAVHEVCMNVVDHAYGPDHRSAPDDISVQGTVDLAAIRITVRDRGDCFDAAEYDMPVPGVPQIRGYGLVIVHKLADDVDYRHTPAGNVWSLRFDRPSTRSGDRG